MSSAVAMVSRWGYSLAMECSERPGPLSKKGLIPPIVRVRLPVPGMGLGARCHRGFLRWWP